MAEALKEPFEELLKHHPIDFVVPDRVRAEMQRNGMANTVSGDCRGAPRFRTQGPAILSWIRSPEALQKPQATRQVIIRDISKNGVGLLTSTEWFPEQIARLQFAVGEMEIKIMRARRVGPGCFEVGARVLRFEKREDSD